MRGKDQSQEHEGIWRDGAVEANICRGQMNIGGPDAQRALWPLSKYSTAQCHAGGRVSARASRFRQAGGRVVCLCMCACACGFRQHREGERRGGGEGGEAKVVASVDE